MVASELGVLVEHFTGTRKPSPEFMMAHMKSLSTAITYWSERETKAALKREPPVNKTKPVIKTRLVRPGK